MRGFLEASLQAADSSCREARIVPLDLDSTGSDPRRHSIQSGDLRLFNLRPRFNLPITRSTTP